MPQPTFETHPFLPRRLYVAIVIDSQEERLLKANTILRLRLHTYTHSVEIISTCEQLLPPVITHKQKVQARLPSTVYSALRLPSFLIRPSGLMARFLTSSFYSSNDKSKDDVSLLIVPDRNVGQLWFFVLHLGFILR
jgi:hypothetical protein